MSKQAPPQRLPAPSLFVGPPSHNASTASLARANTDTSQTSRPSIPASAIPGPTSPNTTSSPGVNGAASLSRTNTRDPLSRSNTTASRHEAQIQEDPGVGLQNSTANQEVKRQRPRRGTAVLDAHWAALQSTLSDIELSAASSAHVFGIEHAKALEELRAAQVELARAWGSTDSSASASSNTANPTTDKRDVSSKPQESSGNGAEADRKLSTASTTLDLSSAAARRENSDKYFTAVKEGVAEVVRKLDGVAEAMRRVEMQSRDIWGDDGAAKSNSDLTSEFGSLSS